MSAPTPSCWVLSDGTAGMEAQALGLAEAMGLDPVVKTIRPSRLLRLAPSLARFPGLPAAAGGHALDPPYPAISISCGRRHAGAAIALKRASGGRVFSIQIQDPRLDPALFDILVVPEHDPTRGPNVITTTGSLNRISRALLDSEAGAFSDRMMDLPHPRVAVNIGGDTREYTVGEAQAGAIARALMDLADTSGCGLMVATSRRTGPDLRAALSPLRDRADTVLWTGDGPNPYLGFLGLADHIIVTSDSINMVSEACSTGKPVHVLELGHEPRRRATFLDDVRTKGLVRDFSGTLETWSVPPLRETQRVAKALVARLRASGILP